MCISSTSLDQDENEDTQQVLPLQQSKPLLSTAPQSLIKYAYAVSNQFLPAKHYNHDDATQQKMDC